MFYYSGELTPLQIDAEPVPSFCTLQSPHTYTNSASLYFAFAAGPISPTQTGSLPGSEDLMLHAFSIPAGTASLPPRPSGLQTPPRESVIRQR